MKFRIKEARKMSGMTQKELAARLAVSVSTLSEYESGKYDPRSDVLCEIADICGVSVDFLLCRPVKSAEPARLTEQALNVAKVYNGLDDHGKRIVDSVLEEETRRMAEEQAAREKAIKAAQNMEAAGETNSVRYIRHYLVPSAAGYASPVEGEDYELIEAGPDVPRNADFCIDIDGDSMEPRIREGDLALVHRQPTLESGELGVLVYGEGEGTLKKFVRRGNAIILQPFSPAYQPQVILGEDLERLHVVGKVVETKAKW